MVRVDILLLLILPKEKTNYLQLHVQDLTQPLIIAALTGHSIILITSRANNLHLVIFWNHHEKSEFFVFEATKPQVMPGFT